MPTNTSGIDTAATELVAALELLHASTPHGLTPLRAALDLCAYRSDHRETAEAWAAIEELAAAVEGAA